MVSSSTRLIVTRRFFDFCNLTISFFVLCVLNEELFQFYCNHVFFVKNNLLIYT